MVDKILSKLMEHYYNNNACNFDVNEIEFITKNYYAIDVIDKNEEYKKIRMLYLIANTKTNLENNFINFAKNFLCLINNYYHEDLGDWIFYGIKCSEIHKNSIKIQDKVLSLEQQFVYESFEKMDTFLKAGTGIGKTFLASNYLIKKYTEYRKKNNDYKKFIFIVPTEILEDQIIDNLRKNNKIYENHIGNSVEDNDVIITTWEKLVPYINYDSIDLSIDTLIIDEFFLIFEENDRSCLLKHLLECYIKNAKKNDGRVFDRIILLTPIKPNDKQQEETKKLFESTCHKFFYINFDNSEDVSNKIFYNKLTSPTNNEKDFNQFVINNYSKTICIYYSKKYLCKRAAKKFYENDLLIKNILSINENKINEMNKLLDSLSEKFNKYLNYKYIKKGICYLTSDVPDEIKRIIIELVKNGYIKIVCTTYIIINGVDLPFDCALLSSNYVNNNELSRGEIVNFFGRCGRKNEMKKGFSIGTTLIRVNKKNKEWYIENKNFFEDYIEQNILKDNLYKENLNEYKMFIKNSYQQFDEKKDSVLLMDPRINPLTTYRILKDCTEDDYISIVKTIFWNESEDKWKKIIKMVEKIFNIYVINDYNKIDNESKFDKICKHVAYYLMYDFNLELALSKYIKSYMRNSNMYDEKNMTKNIEIFVHNSKTYGKFLFCIFVNHMYLVINGIKEKYTNINIIKTYYVSNKIFYIFLKDKLYLKDILNEFNDKNFKNKWKKINNIIFSENEILQNLKNDHISFKTINKEKIIQEYEKFLNARNTRRF